jgi:mannose-6-phosphate isomerase-like protein (cupin superfamily)
MDNYRLVNLDVLSGGNVLIGPEVGEGKIQTTNMMLGFNRNDSPWDTEMHYHEMSREIYIILKGGLTLKVGEESVYVGANRMLVVEKCVPHDIEDFHLPIEFITIRVPAEDDKVVVG